MPTDNVELARAVIDAFNRHDYDAGLPLFDEAVVWTVGSDLMLDSDVFIGRDGVRRFWDLWHDTFSDFELVVEECTEAPGGHVVTLVHSHGFGAGSGAEVSSPPFAQIFRIGDGRITHVWLHMRMRTARQAAGLDEAD